MPKENNKYSIMKPTPKPIEDIEVNYKNASNYPEYGIRDVRDIEVNYEIVKT